MTSDSLDSLYPGMLNVVPKIKKLLPNQSVTFLVKYFPGYTGEFLKYFIVEVLILLHTYNLYRVSEVLRNYFNT